MYRYDILYYIEAYATYLLNLFGNIKKELKKAGLGTGSD